MDTSGDGIVDIVLYLVVLAIFVQIALRLIAQLRPPRPFPVLAVVLAVVIGVPSLLQFAVPAVGSALERDPALTLQDGQWWRVVTAVAAQDGGPVAAIFNLVVLVVVVTLCQWIWGAWRALALFLIPSIVLNLLALAWNATGGGSSFASDGLIMSVIGLALVVAAFPLVRILAGVTVVIAAVLVAIDDAHGVAMLLGAALGVGAALAAGRRWAPLRSGDR